MRTILLVRSGSPPPWSLFLAAPSGLPFCTCQTRRRQKVAERIENKSAQLFLACVFMPPAISPIKRDARYRDMLRFGRYSAGCWVASRGRMNLAEKIEQAFAARLKPAQVRLGDEVLQLDSDVEEALWFSGRDWHELRWQDWQEHASATYFFDPESFRYYLPSVLLLAVENPNESLTAAESLISELDRSPDVEGWTAGFAVRFLGLNLAELDALKEWLLYVCEYAPYKGWGIAASGPGDTFGRAFDTVDLLKREIERRCRVSN